MTGSRSYRARIAGFVLATGCALLLQPAAATAATSSTPVDIDECRIVGNRADVSAYKPIVLSFTNRRPTAANVVAFTIDYAGRSERIIDRGSFMQNVRIDHAFAGFYNARYRGPSPSLCRVDYVGFADGTAWPTPSAAPAPS
ncbi:MAG TPA: hypothetical protein VNU22_04525 [Candidatus Acidoferrum sp.]|jgi:hypothetical protein|nr:hypothetical protein [Candidatus Acidoferrum sp.]